jgi:hypothetical protein
MVNIIFITEYQIFPIIVPLRVKNSLNFETNGIRSVASKLYLRNFLQCK